MCAHLKLLLLASLLGLGTSAQAVVLDSQVLMTREGYDYSVSPFATTYRLDIYQEPLNPNGWTDYTQIWFNHRSGSLTFKMTTIDEASDWYLVPAGAEFSAKTISEGGFPILVRSGYPNVLGSIAIPSGPFYLGVNTGRGMEPNGVMKRNIFGWVSLEQTGGGILPVTLTLKGSAMAYNEGGIIVGTQTAIPEPGTSAVLASGAALIFTITGRKRSKLRT